MTSAQNREYSCRGEREYADAGYPGSRDDHRDPQVNNIETNRFSSRMHAFIEMLIDFFCILVEFSERPAVKLCRALFTMAGVWVGSYFLFAALITETVGFFGGMGISALITVFGLLGLRDTD